MRMRSRMRIGMAALLCLVASACAHPGAQGPQADENGDPARGLTYAAAQCSSCHAVRASDALSPNPQAPRFEAVANMPGFTHMAFNAWLHTSHPSMPNLIVEPSHMDDIYAYIGTMRRR